MRKPSNTLLEAMDQMEQIPGIAGVWSEVRCQTRHTKPMRKTDWAFITSSGWLYVNTEREASCPEWVYILSHCCLHLALGHIREDRKTDAVWEHACDCIAAKMLLDLRIGRPPAEFAEAPPANAKEETAFYHWLLEHPTVKIPRFATMTDGRTGMIFDWLPSGQDWARLFAEDLQWSIRQTLRGCADGQTARPCTCRPAELARSWFLSCYPLLGAVAARFRLIADSAAVSRLGVGIAAVSCHMAEIYINPYAGLRTEEWRFVLAHEFLHAALQHAERLNGRQGHHDA